MAFETHSELGNVGSGVPPAVIGPGQAREVDVWMRRPNAAVEEIIIAAELISTPEHSELGAMNVHGEGLKRISDVVREKNVSAGELVFAEKDLGEEMYLVYNGRILIYQDLAGRHEKLESVGPGGYFGGGSRG